jgi:hypothetical protein|tara:strand:- start:5 stop:694 length:690 start_codon:yes stop_codon:yes gene_type:complete
MSIKLKGSTAGSVALDAPANTSPSGSDIALTLPIDAGSANQYLRNGSTAGELEFGSLPTRLNRTYSTELSVGSGDTEIEFTGITANFSRLRLVFHDLSLSGGNNLIVQIGHAGSGGTYFTSGYNSYFGGLGSSTIAGDGATDGFRMRLSTASQSLFGFHDIYPDKASSPTRLYSNTMAIRQDGENLRLGAGYSPDISSVTIDRIKIVPTGSNTFDDTDGRVSLITEVIE